MSQRHLHAGQWGCSQRLCGKEPRHTPGTGSSRPHGGLSTVGRLGGSSGGGPPNRVVHPLSSPSAVSRSMGRPKLVAGLQKEAFRDPSTRPVGRLDCHHKLQRPNHHQSKDQAGSINFRKSTYHRSELRITD